MANYCYNCIRARGKEESIKKFHPQVLETFATPKSSIYELLLAHKYTEEELKEVDRRDYICDAERELSYDPDRKEYYFDFYTESAWGPNLGMLFQLMKERYNQEIELIYISEECGNEIYVTNDKEHEVWGDRYFMDYTIGDKIGSEYFAYKQELINYIKSVFGVEVSKKDTLDKMEGRILQKYGIKDPEDQYVSIHEFQYSDMYAA